MVHQKIIQTFKYDLDIRSLMLKAVHSVQLRFGYCVEFRIGPLAYGR